MKSLKESLFDDDLIEKNINFFDFYSWSYGYVAVLLPSGAWVPLQSALGCEIRFDQLFKRDKLNKLPHPKELIEKSNDEYILRNIYNTLSTSSIEELGDRLKLSKTISNAVRELLKVKTMGGGTKCDVYPSPRHTKTILDDDIKSILINDELNFQIGSSMDNTYRLKTTVSLKKNINIMKSLRESLFDKNLVSKDITIDQCFEISIDRHADSRCANEKDIRAIESIKKDLNSLSIKGLDCEGLIKILARASKNHTDGWRGGGYSYTVYNNSNRALHNSRELKNTDLLNDVRAIVLNSEDHSNNYTTFYTRYLLKRK